MRYEDVFKRYYPVIRGKLMKDYRGTLSFDDADDIASRTFEKVLEKFDQYDPARGSWFTWIWWICRGVTSNYRRKGSWIRDTEKRITVKYGEDKETEIRNKVDTVAAPETCTWSNPAARQKWKRMVSDIEAGFQELGPTLEAIARDRYDFELTFPEIAKRHGISESKAKRLASKARDLLKEGILKKYRKDVDDEN